MLCNDVKLKGAKLSPGVTAQVRSGLLKRGKKRMTRASGLQCRQERKPLFAQGRQIATNAAKSMGTRQTAEAAGDLLLHFEHAQIALGQVVGPSRQLHRLHL